MSRMSLKNVYLIDNLALDVTKKSNAVTSNGVTRKRDTGKKLSRLKITKPAKMSEIVRNRWKVKGQGAERQFVMFLIRATAAHIIPCT